MKTAPLPPLLSFAPQPRRGRRLRPRALAGGIAALLAGAALDQPAPVSAASIIWGSATGISGVTDVSTAGTSVGALALQEDFMSTGNLTLNGVTFQTFSPAIPPGSPPVVSGQFTFADFHDEFSFGTIPAATDYATFLGEGAGGAGPGTPTLTISGLTVGDTYSFQIWDKNDNTVTAMAGNSVTLDGSGTGQFAIGTFAASATTQAITFSFAGGINGFQLRLVALPAFWTGDQGSSWATNNGGNTNWATTTAGTTDAGAPPGPSTTVTISATSNVTPGSQTAMTLDQDFTIYSLTVNDSNAVTINSGAATHTLTISGAAGTGIDVQSGAGLFTLNANLTLAGSSDTINVSNSAGAVITGLLNAANGLIKTGTGTLTLTAQNTYTTGTTVNGGTLQIGDGANTATLVAATGALTSMAGGLGGTSVTVDNGSTLNVMAHATVTGGAGGAGAVGLNTGAFGALGGVGSNGGDGGSAAVFLLGGSLSVSGGMSGGTGGVGGQGGGGGFGAPGAGDGGVGGVAGGGGAGGDAVVFSSGGSLTGSGSITGGSGGSGGRGGIGGAD